MSGHKATVEPTKRCWMCGEVIWAGAKKCVHCDSDLTWTRFVTFSNTTLALITALIAVLAAASPAIITLMTPKVSVLESEFVGISQSSRMLSMLFSNSGRRTGAINNVRVFVTWGSDARSFTIDPETKDDGATFIEPGKTVGQELIFDGARIHWEPAEAAADLKELDGKLLLQAKCQVIVRGVNSDGSEYMQRKDFSCIRYGLQIFRRLVQTPTPLETVPAPSVQ
jgi:hypothetical protein